MAGGQRRGIRLGPGAWMWQLTDSQAGSWIGVNGGMGLKGINQVVSVALFRHTVKIKLITMRKLRVYIDD